jgi:outer membrane protein TolC
MRTAIVIVLLLASGPASNLRALLAAAGQGQRSPGAAVEAPIALLDAVQSTLARHPLLDVQRQQVEISRAQKQQRSADFDTQLRFSPALSRTSTPLAEFERPITDPPGLSPDTFIERSLDLVGSAHRLLRSGIAIGPTVVMSRTTDNLQSLSGVNRTRVSFDVNVPLLRGKGRDVVTAPESAAEIGVQASLYDLNQEIADLILSTAGSYWQYVASLRQLQIIAESEARGQEFVDAVTTLVQADKLPRSEIHQAQANLAGRAASRITVEQEATEARSNLALAMGLAPEQLDQLPPPADDFPDGVNQPAPSIAPEKVRSLIGLALTRRADYLAADKAREAADLIRRSVSNRLRPQLDLTISGGYSTLREGRGPNEFLVSPFAGMGGPNAVVGFRYAYPYGNGLALGQVAEAEASYQQAVLLRTERARVISNGVVNALTAIFNGINRLNRANEAVTAYRAALDGERDKLSLGVGSIIDILTIEGRLTQALLDLVSAQQAYAVSLVQLRHAGGMLVEPGGATHSFERDVFFRPMPQAY